MEIRPLTERYAVSPQIAPADLPALRDAGYTAVICNRPDAEVTDDLGAAAMQEAAEAAGLNFVNIPVVHGALGPDVVDAQRRAIDEADGPVLAYCASGTRSTIVWMLGAAPETAPDALLQAAQSQGYALEMLRPQLEALHRG
jgi:uncharacterized protein (TIGR01244 family)